VQLFRFSAVSWNSHRIHYDAAYAASEGFPGTVVQSTLHGEMLVRHALDWAGPDARLAAVSWRNQATAVADEPLTWKAVVQEAEPGPDGLRLSLDAAIVKADGTPCVTGTVELLRPS
jgi:hydroxyacyl-ACP dehydratase HTD2-like protein with hotdog domain